MSWNPSVESGKVEEIKIALVNLYFTILATLYLTWYYFYCLFASRAVYCYCEEMNIGVKLLLFLVESCSWVSYQREKPDFLYRSNVYFVTIAQLDWVYP